MLANTAEFTQTIRQQQCPRQYSRRVQPLESTQKGDCNINITSGSGDGRVSLRSGSNCKSCRVPAIRRTGRNRRESPYAGLKVVPWCRCRIPFSESRLKTSTMQGPNTNLSPNHERSDSPSRPTAERIDSTAAEIQLEHVAEPVRPAVPECS